MSVNATVKLDAINELQPDLVLRKKDGGACSVDVNGYFCVSPELVGEISCTSSHRDLHEKEVYELCGVKEYVIWRTKENQVDWFILQNGRYQKIEAVDGVITSVTFPGLALIVRALTEGNSSEVIQTLGNAMNEQ